ncbi:MAG: tetratricopeptide repeat protein, partial [Isosphaerales bacterium]
KGVPITRFCDERRLSTRERLELAIPVCQAVQHAHQKGVIHRDLKPSNILVALYDDKPVPKVIDFGVAKATGQRLTDQTLFTEFGSVVGTLEYMSPEQAQLNQLDIDTRSDVYSLGVLLYELLTGSTPLDRKRLKEAGFLEVLRVIREAESPRPSMRLSTTEELPSIAACRGIEPRRLSALMRGDLDWIVMKALEKDRNRRYETANELARDVEHYLHDEPVLACPPSARYRFRKFARRHKAGLQIAAAAALVLLLAVGGVTWALLDRAMRRTELSKRMAETEQTVNAALIQTDQWRKQASEAPSATSQEADAILALWRQAEASLAQAETALRTGTADDRLRERVLDVRQRIEQQGERARRTAKLLRDLDEARLSRSNLIEQQYHYDNDGPAPQYATAFAAYDLEVKPGHTEELARRIRAEDPGIRDALILALDDWSQNRGIRPELQAIAGAVDDDPWRQKYRAAATAKDAVALRALSRDARQLALPPSSLVLLARSLRDAGERDECLALLRWGRGRHPTDFWLHFESGLCFPDGASRTPVEVEEAIGCYRAALALRPTTAGAHYNLGGHLARKKQWDKAIAEYRRTIELDPYIAGIHNNLGVALGNKKQWDEAIAEYRKAIELDPRYMQAHDNLGNVLLAKSQFDEAIAEYKKAIELDPKYSMAHSNLGNLLRARNRFDKAIAESRKAIDRDPKNAQAHNNLGAALSKKKQWEEAITEYRKAVDLDPKWAVAHDNLGYPLRKKNQLDEGIAEYRKAVDLDPKWAVAHNNLGLALAHEKQLDEGIAEYRKAVDLDPKWAQAHYNLGLALSNKDQWDEVIAEYRKAIELDPKDAILHNGMAWVLATHPNPQLRDPGRAVNLAKEAVELAPREGPMWNTLGVAHFRAGDWKAALAALEKSMELRRGGDSTDWFFLAMAHEKLGDKEKARQWYDRATRWIDKNQATNEELRRFGAEAAQVLGVAKKKD